MQSIPRDSALDSTIALRRDPYHFISDRCRRHRSDLFETRIFMRRTLCMSGQDAARLFYDTDRFQRAGAAPAPMARILFGEGGVQGLDDREHRHRKRMLLSLMTPARVTALVDITDRWWSRSAHKWSGKDRVVLYDELQELLTRSVCEWAGVPLEEEEVSRRVHDLVNTFDTAGNFLRPWRPLMARRRADTWATDVICGVRQGRIRPPAQSAATVLALHRNLAGNLLPPKIAAVDLLNVLRPTVAVSVFITFAAHALHHHPECREALLLGGDNYAELFVHEVRRYYPFFPAVPARVRRDFQWHGFRFPAGRRALLDLYGTDHDERIWEQPEEFLPERFRRWDGSPFNFIPQGGGRYQANHRCAGEPVTIQLMKAALPWLARRMEYEVPPQDLAIDETRLPALPRSRFIIRNVTARA